MKIFSARWWEMEPTGSLCQMVHTAWEPPCQERVLAKEGCLVALPEGKKKKEGLGAILNERGLEARMMTRVFRHCAMRVCVQANKGLGGDMAINSPLGLCEDGFLRL